MNKLTPIHRLGDKVTVQVSSVSLDERRINLVLAGEAQQDRYARRRAQSAPAKPSVRAQLKAGKIPGKKAQSVAQTLNLQTKRMQSVASLHLLKGVKSLIANKLML